MKFEKMAKQPLFGRAESYRILVFGNSRTLAGFRPEVFDEQFGGAARSYNFGIPGELKFLPILRKIIEDGNRPSHVLLQLPWSGEYGAGSSSVLKDDRVILKTLLPFRNLPRDSFVFLYSAAKTGGPLQAYQRMRAEVELVERQRGWYFIHSQSRFANDSLPVGYSLPTDRPEVAFKREVPMAGEEYAEVLRLARQYGFKILLIPNAVRQSEYASVPDGSVYRDLSRQPSIRSVGPDYWTYAASNFADPVHLNPSGAIEHTRRLATLIRASGAFE